MMTMDRNSRRLLLACLAAAGGLTGSVSVQHVALTAVAATALDHSLASCPALSSVLTPALVGSIAGGIVAIVGAVGSVLLSLRRAGPPSGPAPK